MTYDILNKLQGKRRLLMETDANMIDIMKTLDDNRRVKELDEGILGDVIKGMSSALTKVGDVLKVTKEGGRLFRQIKPVLDQVNKVRSIWSKIFNKRNIRKGNVKKESVLKWDTFYRGFLKSFKNAEDAWNDFIASYHEGPMDVSALKTVIKTLRQRKKQLDGINTKIMSIQHFKEDGNARFDEYIKELS